MADLDRVKRNISRMIGMNAPEADIDAYIASEGVSIEQVRAHKLSAPAPAEKKERSWADVPMEAAGNIPASAAKFATDIVQPILSPVETAKSLWSLGQGLGSKAMGAVGFPQDPARKAEVEAGADAVGQFFKDRYGSIEAAKKTIATDPVGFLGDVTVPLTAGGGLAARAPGVAGRAGAAVQRVGQAVDPLNVAGKAAKLTGKAATTVSGVLTGVGSAPIEEAAKAGFAGKSVLREHMKDPTRITEVVDMADSAAKEIVRDRGNAYNANMATTRANPTPIDVAPIRKGLDAVGSSITFKNIVKDPKALSVHSQIVEKFNEFMGLPPAERTAEAMDAFKQAVGAIRDTTEQGTGARRVADRVYNDVKAAIIKQAPDYAKAMNAYSEASDTITELKKTLGANNEKMSTDTALRKLQSTMRNNVNTNYGARTKLLDELTKKEPNLKPAIAGQALNDWAPRGLARIGGQLGAVGGVASMNPMALAVALMSPRLTGEVAYGLGRGAKVVKDAADVVGRDKLLEALLVAYQTGNVLRPLPDQ